MKRVLVLCTGNSCRSQLAEGYLKYFAGDKAEVYSAGIETHGVNPRAIATMKEDGIDISNQTSNNVEEYRNIVWFEAGLFLKNSSEFNQRIESTRKIFSHY